MDTNGSLGILGISMTTSDELVPPTLAFALIRCDHHDVSQLSWSTRVPQSVVSAAVPAELEPSLLRRDTSRTTTTTSAAGRCDALALSRAAPVAGWFADRARGAREGPRSRTLTGHVEVGPDGSATRSSPICIVSCRSQLALVADDPQRGDLWALKCASHSSSWARSTGGDGRAPM